MVPRTCKVSVRDLRQVEHTVEVTAETLFDAVASALAVFKEDSWVEEIAQGLNVVSVFVQQPPLKHEVKMQDFFPGLKEK